MRKVNYAMLLFTLAFMRIANTVLEVEKGATAERQSPNFMFPLHLCKICNRPLLCIVRGQDLSRSARQLVISRKIDSVVIRYHILCLKDFEARKNLFPAWLTEEEMDFAILVQTHVEQIISRLIARENLAEYTPYVELCGWLSCENAEELLQRYNLKIKHEKLSALRDVLQELLNENGLPIFAAIDKFLQTPLPNTPSNISVEYDVNAPLVSPPYIPDHRYFMDFKHLKNFKLHNLYSIKKQFLQRNDLDAFSKYELVIFLLSHAERTNLLRITEENFLEFLGENLELKEEFLRLFLLNEDYRNYDFELSSLLCKYIILRYASSKTVQPMVLVQLISKTIKNLDFFVFETIKPSLMKIEGSAADKETLKNALSMYLSPTYFKTSQHMSILKCLDFALAIGCKRIYEERPAILASLFIVMKATAVSNSDMNEYISMIIQAPNTEAIVFAYRLLPINSFGHDQLFLSHCLHHSRESIIDVLRIMARREYFSLRELHKTLNMLKHAQMSDAGFYIVTNLNHQMKDQLRSKFNLYMLFNLLKSNDDLLSMQALSHYFCAFPEYLDAISKGMVRLILSISAPKSLEKMNYLRACEHRLILGSYYENIALVFSRCFDIILDEAERMIFLEKEFKCGAFNSMVTEVKQVERIYSILRAQQNYKGYLELFLRSTLPPLKRTMEEVAAFYDARKDRDRCY